MFKFSIEAMCLMNLHLVLLLHLVKVEIQINFFTEKIAILVKKLHSKITVVLVSSFKRLAPPAPPTLR